MCIKTYRLATLTISFNHLLNYSVSIPSRLHHYPSDDVILKDAILEDAIILVTILEEEVCCDQDGKISHFSSSVSNP
jgi:hypothetical protein